MCPSHLHLLCIRRRASCPTASGVSSARVAAQCGNVPFLTSHAWCCSTAWDGGWMCVATEGLAQPELQPQQRCTACCRGGRREQWLKEMPGCSPRYTQSTETAQMARRAHSPALLDTVSRPAARLLARTCDGRHALAPEEARSTSRMGCANMKDP